jgi:hypothetical protein
MSVSTELPALRTAFGKLERCREALTDLSYLWADSRPQPLWWDDLFQTFVTSGHRKIYPNIFGSHPHLRAILARQALGPVLRAMAKTCSRQRWHGPFDLGIPLPQSAALIPPIASKEGIVCASADTGTVMKLNFGRPEVEVETKCWAIALKAGISEHVPEILEQGFAAGDGRWMLSRLAPNSSPLDRPINPFPDRQKRWLHWMRWNILPVMQEFYDCAGVSEVNCQQILGRFSSTHSNQNTSDVLERLVKLVESSLSHARSDRAVSSLTHKDLIPSHIHRHGKNWWIMDWGSAGHGLVVKEVFRQYFWTPPDQTPGHKAFWIWMRTGHAPNPMPATLQSQIALFLDWYSAWRNEEMDADTLRSHLLCALLMDYDDVIRKFPLQDRIHLAEGMEALPSWVRTISGQVRALGLQG